jgi:hypothetical protein
MFDAPGAAPRVAAIKPAVQLSAVTNVNFAARPRLNSCSACARWLSFRIGIG